MRLTKEIVDQMLAANTKNRSVRTRHVETLARQMRNGFFVPNNGQAIVINKSFTWLLDGQHRLLAIRAAGYPIYDIDVKVVDDCDAEKCFHTIDTNAMGRNPAQVLALDGMPNACRRASLVRALARYAWSQIKISVEETKRYIDLFDDEIRRVHVCQQCMGVRPTASYTAAVVNAMLIEPNRKDEIEGDWLSILENSVPLDKPSLKSILGMILMKSEPNFTLQFFKTTKGLLFPDKKTLKIANDEDKNYLRCRQPSI